MKSMNRVPVERFLSRVKRPGRYIGREWNLPQKDFTDAKVQMVMAFPDLYEVGMSHLGLRILYEVVNRQDTYSMERAMAPAPDLEACFVLRIRRCSLWKPIGLWAILISLGSVFSTNFALQIF